MKELQKGRYRARFSETMNDLNAALKLRTQVFRPNALLEAVPLDQDRDAFDDIARHVLVEDIQTGQVVACYRLLLFVDGGQIENSYCARFYDLSRLQSFAKPMVELGRFCTHPDFLDLDILRIAWAMLVEFVEENQVKLLFGCTSFVGIEPQKYQDSFMILHQNHQAPEVWKILPKSENAIPFSSISKNQKPDFRNAMKRMPPLLRTYLAMGGWVSDHVVVDEDLQTLHIFTGLEIAKIPAERVRNLKSISR